MDSISRSAPDVDVRLHGANLAALELLEGGRDDLSGETPLTRDRMFGGCGYLDRNRHALARLHALADGLSEQDLRVTLSTGWDVATTLAHLAFWDRAAIASLRAWQRLPADKLAARLADRAGWVNEETKAPLRVAGISENDAAVMEVEEMNDRLVDAWSRVPPREAAKEAVRAAAGLLDTITALDREMAGMIAAGRFAFMLTPSGHWREHIDAIEMGLAA